MIRLAQSRDEVEIRRCAQQAYTRYVPLIGRKPAPIVADFPAQIAEGWVYVATDDQGSFQGYIVFYAEGSHVLLESVAVLPSAAGRGVGRALIGVCEDAARQSGLKGVRLYTNEKMTDNLLIYPKLGYVQVAQRTEDGFKRVYFEKSIPRDNHGVA